MSTKSKLSHVVYECKYHIVIVPKYRFKIFLSRERKIFMRDEIRRICQWKRVEIIEGNVCADHVHLCLSIPPKYAVAHFVGLLKGKMAIKMFEKFTELRKKYWGSHFWARGYYVSTVGINENTIRKYIKNQETIERREEQGTLFE
jgi:putative transposase